MISIDKPLRNKEMSIDKPFRNKVISIDKPFRNKVISIDKPFRNKVIITKSDSQMIYIACIIEKLSGDHRCKLQRRCKM